MLRRPKQKLKRKKKLQKILTKRRKTLRSPPMARRKRKNPKTGRPKAGTETITT